MARYIDADILTEAMKYYHSHTTEDSGEHYAYGVALKEINRTPTADVAEVKHGHWIKRGNEKKCSVCGFIYYSNNDDWNGCPNCGAKMDGGS